METPSLVERQSLQGRNESKVIYLKIRRADTAKWQYIFGIKEAIAIGPSSEDNFDEYGAYVFEELNNGEGDPYVVILTNVEDDTRAYAFWATEAYLCDQKTGLTVEWLFKLK